jgi:Leucine-rich repeat (LRR) protein
VTFAVTSGGGTLSVTSTTTDTDGRAESALTLGADGENTVSASVEGISETVTFSDEPEEGVHFPDLNLRAEIESALNKQAGDPITAADMTNLTRLEAPNANISDLTGLEHATNLTSLYLGSNSISDISSLVANTGLGNRRTSTSVRRSSPLSTNRRVTQSQRMKWRL